MNIFTRLVFHFEVAHKVDDVLKKRERESNFVVGFDDIFDLRDR